MDNLAQMFEMQKKLQSRLGYNFDKMSQQRIFRYIEEYLKHSTHELHELWQEVPEFKSWKKYNTENQDYVEGQLKRCREEYVDVLHFLLNIGLALGFDSDSLLQAYMEKNIENYVRQENTSAYKACVDGETKSNGIGD